MKIITIIGGGAAGMMAAATICERGDSRVVIFEKNEQLGKKVAITGGGRCNVTTGLIDIKEVLTKYPRGSRFLRDSMYKFSPQAMQEWVTAHGVPLKTEADMRVFPKSDKSRDVIKIFEDILEKAEVIFDKEITEVKKQGDKFIVDGIKSDKLMLTTGGAGYEIAKSLGHKITPLAPSLNPFTVAEQWVKDLPGISFQKARLKIKKHEFTGPILLTHKGVSGPAVFAISALAAYEELPTKLLIDFIPDITREELTDKLRDTNGAFEKVLNTLAPKSFVKKITAGKKMAQIVEAFKNTQLTIQSREGGKEFVTAGGVDLTEVDSKTMESKICPGLYLAGEILDIDGFTGGFNLQAAWATGRAAGESAA